MKNPITSHSTSFENVLWICSSIISFESFPRPNFLRISLSRIKASKAAPIIAGIAAGIWNARCRKKNITTRARVERDAIRSFLCFIGYCFSISFTVLWKCLIFFTLLNSPLKTNQRVVAIIMLIIMIGTPRLVINALNESPA